MTNITGNAGVPNFVKWLVPEPCSFRDGTAIECWRLDWKDDPAVLDDWAVHLRRHYIFDDTLKQICDARHEKANSYLSRRVVPSKTTTRTGDFGEILISDIFEYLRAYKVPRYKQCNRKDKNQSEHGVDVIAYRIQASGKKSPNDELVAIEVKSNASGTTPSELVKRIMAATSDSGKDPNRVPMTLDYFIDEAIRVGDNNTLDDLQRFSDKGGTPYKLECDSAVTTSNNNPFAALSQKDPSDVALAKDSSLIIVHGDKFMELINGLYDRIAK